jgi:hypothetical protein
MFVQVWTEVLAASLQDLWGGFISLIPSLVGAVLILIVGLIVAAGLGALIERVVGLLKLDSLVTKAGAEKYFKRAGLKLDIGRFFGRLTYWFIVIAFILAASDILQFSALSTFLRSVLLYIPQVVVAALIMLAAVVVGNFLRDLVKASVMGAKLNAANFLGTLTWWSVVVFGLLAALSQLGIAVTIINTLVTGFVVMIALAGGIAFGLGGKDYANHLIGKFREQVEEK